MKYWVITAILLVNIIIQSTLFSFLQIMGTQPDTLIMLVTGFSLLDSSGIGIIAGLAGGLIQDIMYGGPLGLNAVQYMIIAYLIGLLRDKIFVGKVFVPAVAAFCSTIIRGLMMMGYLYFTRSEIPMSYGFTLVILPEAVYTAVLMPVVFYFLSILFSKRFMKKKWHFRRR